MSAPADAVAGVARYPASDVPGATHEAICVRRAEFAEHDAVVCFLTRDAGKLTVTARGVRRPRSKLAPACQLLCRSRIQVASGRRLGVLTQVVVLDSHYALRQKLLGCAQGLYLCELCDRTLPDDEPHPEVFELLCATLDGLQAAEDGAAWCASFELRLLAHLGYEPVLDACDRTGRPLGQGALFCPAAGGLIAPDQHQPREAAVPVGGRLVRALRRLLRPEQYGLDLTHVRLPAALADELRAALRLFVAYHLETELKSAAFLEQIQQETRDAS